MLIVIQKLHGEDNSMEHAFFAEEVGSTDLKVARHRTKFALFGLGRET